MSVLTPRLDPLARPRAYAGMGKRERTIAAPAEVAGTGLFTNARVTARFLPAPARSGIRFRRVDVSGAPEVEAHIRHLVATPRRTSLEDGDAHIEMVEHTLAALAGMGISNCVVEVNGPELPGLDGSSQPTVLALQAVGLVDQGIAVSPIRIPSEITVSDGHGGQIVGYPALGRSECDLTYLLDHPHPAVGRQSAHKVITPETFVHEIAAARTFVMLDEVAALKAAGYGRDLTEADLCVFDDDGIRGNKLRFANEPARHKLLDCVGDFALAARPIEGRIVATKSGHALNQAFVQELLRANGEIGLAAA